jgi:arabinan endo-1,5-alpha-L-arabinosidase
VEKLQWPVWPAAMAGLWLGVVLSGGRAAGGEDYTSPSRVAAGCPDPSILASKEDGKFYIFCTGRGIPIWRSDDLLHWERIGRVFGQDVPPWAQAQVPGAKGIWAPDISYRDGLYHLYYCVSTFGSQRSAIGLAVSKSLDPANPDYGWADRGVVLESAPAKTDFNAIDPALFVDRDGAAYLFWGSYWTGIQACRVEKSTGKPAGDPPTLVPVARRARGVQPPAIEGALVIHREGFYYLFVSWDFCAAGLESTYKVVVGRSKSVLGPYVDFQGRTMNDGGGTLVLASSSRWRGPGHNSVLQTPRGDWLVCHAYDAQNVAGGRLLHIRPIPWIDGWPSVGPVLWKPKDETLRRKTDVNVAGQWRHDVDFAVSASIAMESDGSIRRDGATHGTWLRSGNAIELRWPNAKAPGGAWIDRVVLDPDGNGYTGRNQRGQVVIGARK